MLRYITLPDGSSIAAYNLLIGIGIAAAMLYLQYNRDFKKKSESEKFKIHLSLLIAILGGFAAAFIFDAYTQGIPITFSNLNKIGLTFFSGLIFGLGLLILSLKLYVLPVFKTINILVPACCIAHFFGRLGCFFAGCCYGAPTKSVFGVVFPEGSLPHHHYGPLKMHPAQLYESSFVLVVFIILHYSKTRYKLVIYLLSYSLFRFFVEFIRADSRGSALGQELLTPSQLISVGTVAAIVLAWLFYRQKPSAQ